MADNQPLFRDLTNLLEKLPQPYLIEIARQATLGGFKGACDYFLNNQTLESVLRSLFPEFSNDRLAEVETEIGLCAMRNRCWSQMLSMPDGLSVHIRCPNPKRAEALRERKGPAILTFWHLGASYMMGIGLRRIKVPGLILALNPPPPWFRRAVSKETKMFVIGKDPNARIVGLKMALEQLGKGGVVVLAIDGRQGKKDVEVSFLGRRIQLSRGLAVLSRLTGAPIIPCAATWGANDWSLDFRLFDPVELPAPKSLPPDEWEKQVITTTAGRFEGIVRAFPGQARLDRLAMIAEAPPA
jgi:lauroyl/myristoyl acyltransferase